MKLETMHFMVSVPYLKFETDLFSVLANKIAFTFLKDCSWDEKENADLLERAFLFYSMFPVLLLFLLHSSYLSNSILHFCPFLPSLAIITKKTIPPYLLLLQKQFDFLNDSSSSSCTFPPSLFPYFAMRQTWCGSSGSKKPSVCQRIIISHYFITYLLLSVSITKSF